MATADSIEYRDIEGFPGYRIGSDGSVWTRMNTRRRLIETWRQLIPGVQRKRTIGRAYRYVNLSPPNGKYKTFRVHRLVLQAFTGPCPQGCEARHLDGNPANNCIANLAWGTPEENRADNQKNGRHIKGERNPRSKLSESQVIEIRTRSLRGESDSQLASLFGVHQTNIHAILIRKSWRHI